MKKLNLKKLPVLVLLLSAVFLQYPDSNYAGDNKNKVISGRVIYSDNNSPVNGGTVKIIRKSVPNGFETVIENAEINSNGQFRLSNILPGNTDGVKIMCYPNDVEDNIQFEPVTVYFNSAVTSSGNEYNIVIKVERSLKKTPEGFK